MARGDDRPAGRNGGRLPGTLLVLVLAAAGVYIWASLASPGSRAGSAAVPGPAFSVALSLAEEAGSRRPEPAPPPAGSDQAAAPATAAETPSSVRVFRAAGTPTYALAPASDNRAPSGAEARPDPTGPDGGKPWRVHARPFDGEVGRPRVAVVVSGLGLDRRAAEAAIGGLPGGVTLAFSVYAPGLADWIARARAAGHEVLLALPMEPADYPRADPGPQALLTTLTAAQNLARPEQALGRAAGYVGAIAHMGSRFAASESHMRPVLARLHERGLMFLDNGAAASSAVPALASRLGMPWAAAVALNGSMPRKDYDAELGRLERLARDSGRAIAVAAATPLALRRIAAWARGLDARGLALAPVSAMVPTGPTG